MACPLLQGRCLMTSARPAASPRPGAPACTTGRPTLRGLSTPQTAPTGRAPGPAPRSPRNSSSGGWPRCRSPLPRGARAQADTDGPGLRGRAGLPAGRAALPPGLPAHGLSLFLAPAPKAGGTARSVRAPAPAPCWGAPTSPPLTRGHTRCMATAAMCWPRCGRGPCPDRVAVRATSGLGHV